MHWAVKQLLPLKYATGYVHHPAHAEPTAVFATWRMWFGMCFRQRVTNLGRVVETVNPDKTISYG